MGKTTTGAVQAVDKGKGGMHQVPPQLRALGAIGRPNPPVLSRCKCVLKARYGHGKTALIGGSAENVILDLQNGGHSIPRQRALVIPVPSYERLVDAIATLVALRKTDKNCPYRMVWIDTGIDLQRLLCRQIVDEWNSDISDTSKQVDDIGDTWGGRGGYSRAVQRALVLLDQLYEAGYGWGVTVHLVDATAQVPNEQGRLEEQVITKANLFPSFTDGLMPMVDQRITITRLTTEKQGYREVETPAGKVKVADGSPKEVTEFHIDFESVGDKRQGASRLCIPRVTCEPYKSNNPAKPTMWDRVNDAYELGRKALVEQTE